MSLIKMIKRVRTEHDLAQKDLAARLGITPQYLCDLEKGRRLGSVEVVDRLCSWLRLDESERRKWHRAGAQSHGWKV